MAKKPKIPTIEQFNINVRNAMERLNSDATRLGLTAVQLSDVIDLFGDLTTPNTWCYVWELYAGGDETCTKSIRKAIKSLRRKLEHALSQIYNDIPASKWNNGDRSVFGRKTGARAPRTKPGRILEKIVPAIKTPGGGMMKIACKTENKKGRASLPDDATGVMIAYSVVDHPPKNDLPDETTIKRQIIDSAAGCDKTDYFAGATFTLELNPADVGRELQYFLQWYNAKHKEIAGPWCGPFSANI